MIPQRKDIHPGQLVAFIQKQDQRSGNLTEGVVKRILTKSPNHPHGIKIMTEDGLVGRVQEILEGRLDPMKKQSGNNAPDHC